MISLKIEPRPHGRLVWWLALFGRRITRERPYGIPYENKPAETLQQRAEKLSHELNELYAAARKEGWLLEMSLGPMDEKAPAGVATPQVQVSLRAVLIGRST